MAEEELSAKDQLEAMINGTHENDESLVDDEGVNEDVEGEEETDQTTNEDESTEEEESIEDTDQDEDTEEDEGTEGTDDDANQETSEDSEESQDENAQETAEDSEEESDTTGEEETSTEEKVETKETTDEPNYKEFYEKVALAKFTANGREVEGFKDPEDLVRAQQMLHGYSDKMKVFKEYKPFIKTLEERGITQDPEKFNLAMSLLDGDAEAIKKVLKEKEIDPMELDLENIAYAPKNTLPSNAQMLLEDTYEQANNLGISDKFNQVLTKDWDTKSLQELIDNGAVRNDLLRHLSDGTYDIVQNEIQKMELLDATGVLSNAPSVEKYRMAMTRLQQQNAAVQKADEDATKASKVEEEKARIEKERQEVEFKKKAAEKEKQVSAKRKKAASVSKKKKPVKKKTETRPEALKGDEFKDYFKNMLMN